MTMARSLSKWEYNWPNRTLFVPRRYLQLLSPNNVQTWKLLINSATYAVYFFCCSLVACRVQKEQENLPLIYFSKGKSQKEQKGGLEKVSCWLAGFFQVLISVHSVPHLGTVSKKKLIFKKSFYSNYISNNTKFMIEKKISRYLDFLAEWKCMLDFF